MWAPLGRKKQQPGLTSLKKNRSWSCKQNPAFNTTNHSSNFRFIFQGFVFTVPMRLWSLLLASSCCVSHSCLSFSPGKATPDRRIKHAESAWLARVTGECCRGEEEVMGEQRAGVMWTQQIWWMTVCFRGPEQEAGPWQTQHPGAYISTLTAMNLQSLHLWPIMETPLSLSGLIKTRKIPFTHCVSPWPDICQRFHIKQFFRDLAAFEQHGRLLWG